VGPAEIDELMRSVLKVLWAAISRGRRPLAAWRWRRKLYRQLAARPDDVVSVYDHDGTLLGSGVRMELDATHIVFGIPFALYKSAATIRESADGEPFKGRFYFGKAAWLLEPIRWLPPDNKA
jgi:hypothetical protein